jgi:uncharacterized linocin/CFP29 family protein
MNEPNADVVRTVGGDGFYRTSSGRWAGERLLKALKSGQPFSAAVLRDLDTLRKDEWIYLDEALVEAAQIRLRGVADVIAAGLVLNVPNSLGKMVLQYEKVTDMNAAETTLSGMAKTEGDRQEFSVASLPLPITHKDFFIHLRTLQASRERGEALDTTQVRTSGRLIAERIEYMLFNGATGTFGGNSIYGLTSHPDRNTRAHGTNGLWSAGAKTGENILDDVLNMIGDMESDRAWGPYNLYIPSNYSTKMEEDFKAASDKTIRQRLLEVDRLEKIQVVDQLTASNVVLQMQMDTVAMVVGEPLQTVQWDIEGGFQINFKGFTIQLPLIRSDSSNRCGVVHMSGT